jgi:hypothetical protein
MLYFLDAATTQPLIVVHHKSLRGRGFYSRGVNILLIIVMLILSLGLQAFRDDEVHKPDAE